MHASDTSRRQVVRHRQGEAYLIQDHLVPVGILARRLTSIPRDHVVGLFRLAFAYNLMSSPAFEKQTYTSPIIIPPPLHILDILN